MIVNFVLCLLFVSLCIVQLEGKNIREFFRSLPKVDYSIADVNASDIIYKVFQNLEEKEGKMVTEETVAQETLNKTIPTVLLIHGWTMHTRTEDISPWYPPLKDGYFNLGPHNIIYLNWSKAGNKSYTQSSANIKPTGKYIAEFLIASGVPASKVHLVGHSLGSQLSAFIGKYVYSLTGKKIGRITALDPAGPKFNGPEMSPHERLCDADAAFVDVIHSDVYVSGFAPPVGHVDYYPNEGKQQPGCPTRDEVDNCNHARAPLLFIESLETKATAVLAEFSEVNYEVTVRVKENGKEIIFGQHVDTSARGVYYIETNPIKPFLKTSQSIVNDVEN